MKDLLAQLLGLLLRQSELDAVVVSEEVSWLRREIKVDFGEHRLQMHGDYQSKADLHTEEGQARERVFKSRTEASENRAKVLRLLADLEAEIRTVTQTR
jgi:hypothetical protein